MNKEIKKNVQVHVCYAIELSEQKPNKCQCRMWVTRDQAEDMVCSGLARYVVRYERSKPYEDDRQICLVGKAKKTPRCATIEKTHMERAYLDGDLEDQARVNAYGMLTLLARIQVGKARVIIRDGAQRAVPNFVEHNFEPEGGREKDFGVPIFFFTEDNRTEGGHS